MMQEQRAKVNPRSANLSVDTQYATTLICEALNELRSGRTGRCASILEHALVLLPKVETAGKDATQRRRTDDGRGA